MEELPDIKIALIQAELMPFNATANLAMFEEELWGLQGADIDIIVLPEMFNTGFTHQTDQIAEPPNLTTHKWMRQMAQVTGAVITGSFAVKEKNGQIFNRMYWVTPNQTEAYYNKKHVFRKANEHLHVQHGNQHTVVNIKGWRIMLSICYDLRFPVWLRNQNLAYDVLLNVANWPTARHQAWQTLLPARAIENSAYVLGVNRCGLGNHGETYSGGTGIANPEGTWIVLAKNNPETLTASLSHYWLRRHRKRYPFHNDADGFSLTQ